MDLSELLDAYQAGPDVLRRAVAGMTPAQLMARPVPNRWSTLEVVCHLADFDAIYAERMKRVIATDGPRLLAAGREQFARTLAYHSRDLLEELELIELTRRQMLRILRTLPPDAWARVGVYESDGIQDERSLLSLLAHITNHIHHHVRFIEEKRRALNIPTTAGIP
jgi:hypothetical protein